MFVFTYWLIDWLIYWFICLFIYLFIYIYLFIKPGIAVSSLVGGACKLVNIPDFAYRTY